jgi:phage-related protein
MGEYKVKFGIDIGHLKKSFANMRSNFSKTTEDMKANIKNVSSNLKNDLIAGFRKTSQASKQAEKEMGSSAQGIQIGLAGMLDSMKLVSQIGKDMLTGFINASPAASAQMALINFQTNLINKSMGDALAPTLAIIAEKFKILSNFIQSMDESVKIAIISVLSFVVAGTALAGVLLAISAIGAPLIAVLIAIGLAVAALSLAWTKNFLGIKDITMDVAETIGPVFKNLMELFKTESSGMFDSIKLGFNGTGEGLKNLGKQFADFIVNIKPILEILVKLLVVVLRAAIKNIIDYFNFLMKTITGVFEFFNKLVAKDYRGALNELVNLFKIALEFIGKLWMTAFDLLKGVFNAFGIDLEGILKKIATFFINIWDGIVSGFDSFINKFNNFIDNIKTGVNAISGFFSDLKDDIVNIFTSIGDFISDLFTSVDEGISSIANILKGIINSVISWMNSSIISAINGFLNTLKDIDIGGVEPFSWIKTIPTIPLLHSGGEVAKAGDYRLQRKEGVVSAPDMQKIGGISGLRQIINNPQQSTILDNRNNGVRQEQERFGEMNVTIENVNLSGDADLDKFVNRLRQRDISDLGTSGFSMRRY